MRTSNQGFRTPTFILMVAVLGTLALGAPAQAVTTGATARTVVGGGLTVSGIAMVPITTEYQLNWGFDQGTGFMAVAVPTLLIPGIPTLVTGTVQMATGDSAVDDPLLLPAFQRAQAGQALAIPYLLTGGLAGGGTLIAASLGWMYDNNATVPSFVTPILGLGVFGAGIFLAVDGDNALQEVWGKEAVDLRPGSLLIGGGVTCLAMGTGFLAGVTPVMRLSTFNSGNEVGPVLVSAITGVGYMVTGIVMVATGAARQSESYSTDAVASRRDPRVRLDGFGPTYDPTSGTTGFALSGRW